MRNTKTTTPKSLDHYGDLMSVADLAAFLGVSKQTVYSEIREGRFGEPLKFGRSYRVPKIYIAQRYLAGYVIDCQDPKRCRDEPKAS